MLVLILQCFVLILMAMSSTFMLMRPLHSLGISITGFLVQVLTNLSLILFCFTKSDIKSDIIWCWKNLGGGLTVPSNLRILQWQVRKRKNNQLEFLVPWWDLQLGISINQFVSFFAASNSDFR